MAPASKATSKKPRPSPPTGPKLMACRECQKQKIYCSKEHPKCERCNLRSIECVYAGHKKIKINERNLKTLKAKLRRYEETFGALPSETSDPISASLAVAEDDGELTEEEEDAAHESLPDQLKQMSLYLQASGGSADNFIRTARTLSGVSGDDGSLEQNYGFYDPGALPSRRQELHENIPLPPVDIARKYFAAQHMYIGTIFAFSDTDTFEKQLREIYYSDRPRTALNATDSLTYAKFLMILALGRLYSVNQCVGSDLIQLKDDPPGFEYFTYALALLPDIHEECSVLGVETLAYVGYFMQNMNRRDASFLYIGIALRMAINLGLHQEIPDNNRLNEADREHRRRVWWSIYSLDRILSLKSGNPIAIADEDIGVRVPSRLPGETEDSPVVVLRYYTELSRILGEITTLIYRHTSHTAQSLTTAVHSILLSLTRWEDSLPKALRIELDKGKISRESISTFLHYYQCINMTVRPLLFHVVQKRFASIRSAGPAGIVEKERDWRTGLSRKTTTIVSGCISAARNTLLVMSKAAEYGMVATYGYMDGEHAISAAIVLTLVCGSFPDDQANTDCLNKGLCLLKNMGELGNSHVAARYKLLVHLQTILPLSAAAAPVTKNHVPSLGMAEQHEGTGSAFSAPETAESGFFLESVDPGQFRAVPDDSQQPGSQTGMDELTDSAYFNFDFGDMDTLGLLPGADTDILVEDGDSHLWTKAFANPVGFDISQLIPEADMSDYGNL